jgi:P4 family phage/plasmid primase-like protien
MVHNCSPMGNNDENIETERQHTEQSPPARKVIPFELLEALAATWNGPDAPESRTPEGIPPKPVAPPGQAGNDSESREWQAANRETPCPRCLKSDWCRFSKDGRFVACRRVADGGEEKTYSDGTLYYVHDLRPPAERGSSSRTKAKYSHLDGNKILADADTLDLVYRTFLSGLRLKSEENDELKKRGLESTCKRSGYRTLGQERWRGVKQVLEAGLEKHLPHVPGFYVKPDGRWSIKGPEGLVIPTLNQANKVIKLLLRPRKSREDGNKYCACSAAKDGGVSPGNPPHYPAHDPATTDVSTVRVTEGAMKANAACVHDPNKIYTVGLASAAAPRGIGEDLVAFGAKRVLVAFDADAATKHEVAHGLRACVRICRKAGLVTDVETWDAAAGKGIDDALQAGAAINVISGDEAVDAFLETLPKSGKRAPDGVGLAGAPEPSEVPEAPGPPGRRGQHSPEPCAHIKVKTAEDDPVKLAEWHLICVFCALPQDIQIRISGEDNTPAHERRLMRYWREEWYQWAGDRYRLISDAEVKAKVTMSVEERFHLIAEVKAEEYAVKRREGTLSEKDKEPTKQKITSGIIADTMQALRGMCLLPPEIEPPCWLDREGRHEMVSLRNGLLDLKKLFAGEHDVLTPHTPRWFSTTTTPYNFDPEADCPRWKAVIHRNLGSDSGDNLDPAKTLCLQEWFGYSLVHDLSYQIFLEMVGQGGNGKSVVLAALAATVGEDNVSAVSLERLGDRFDLAATRGKLLNIIADATEVDKLAEAILKAFVSGDPVQYERKFKDPYRGKPTARIVLATNNPIHFSDKSEGIFRRRLVLPFLARIQKSERILNMDKASWWEASGELPGILNWALSGLYRIRRQGEFTVPRTSQEAANSLRVQADPARRFLLENCQETAGMKIGKMSLYSSYRSWCEDNGHQPVASNRFGVAVTTVFAGVKDGKLEVNTGTGRRRDNACVGIAMRTNDDHGCVI